MTVSNATINNKLFIIQAFALVIFSVSISAFIFGFLYFMLNLVSDHNFEPLEYLVQYKYPISIGHGLIVYVAFKYDKTHEYFDFSDLKIGMFSVLPFVLTMSYLITTYCN
jgi:hypothetical protein